MKVHMQQTPVPDPPAESVPERPEEEIPFLDKWLERGAKPYFLDGDYCLIREVRHQASALHGRHTFGELRKVAELWNQSNLSHPISGKGLGHEDLFFFDTATTGLGEEVQAIQSSFWDMPFSAERKSLSDSISCHVPEMRCLYTKVSSNR